MRPSLLSITFRQCSVQQIIDLCVENRLKTIEFASVLDTAVALETKAIRVWAGNRGSALTDAAFRKEVIDDALRCADLAAARDIKVCYE